MGVPLSKTVKRILFHTSILELPQALLRNIILVNSGIVILLLVILQPFQLHRSAVSDLLLVAVSSGLLLFAVQFPVSRLVSSLIETRALSRRTIIAVEVITTLMVIFIITVSVFLLRVLAGKVPFSLIQGAEFVGYGLLMAPFLIAVSRTALVLTSLHRQLKEKGIDSHGGIISDHQTIQNDSPLVISGTLANESLKMTQSQFLYAHAQGNYINIVYKTASGEYSEMIRQTMSALQEQLAEASDIVQCHRSYLVNMQKVAHITPYKQGKQLSFIDSESQIPVSRSKVPEITGLFEQHRKRLQR